MSDAPVFDSTIADVTRAVTVLCDNNVDDLPLDLDELAEAWHTLDDTLRQLQVFVTDLAVNVGIKLADMPYDRKDGYRLPSGVVVHHEQRATTRWAGHQLLTDLSTPLIDPDTGEALPAVPTAVLCDIIPGTASDKLTSSNWRIGGLSNLGVDPDDYRTREWRQPIVRKGPGR